MKKSYWKVISSVGILLALVLSIAGCGGGTNQKADQDGSTQENTSITEKTGEQNSAVENIDLRWGTIFAGGAWQVVGQAMFEDIKRENNNITGSILPSGTTANVLGVHKGKFDIGFSLTDATASAWEGTGFFEEEGEIRDIRNVATLYPHASQIVVWNNSDIKTIEDLKGKKVTPGGKGLSSDLETRRLLELYGMSYDDMESEFLSFSDGTQRMIDGQVDALLYTATPYPFAPIIKVGAKDQIRLVEIPKDKAEQLAQYKGVETFVFPAGTYDGVDYDVQGIAVRSHIIVREDMSEDVVYSIVKSIAENFERYGDVIGVMKNTTMENMASDVGIPFHPGALKYYQEQGWVK